MKIDSGGIRAKKWRRKVVRRGKEDFHCLFNRFVCSPWVIAPSKLKSKHTHVPALLAAICTERRLASQHSYLGDETEVGWYWTSHSLEKSILNDLVLSDAEICRNRLCPRSWAMHNILPIHWPKVPKWSLS